jgi:hypothetical protein
VSNHLFGVVEVRRVFGAHDRIGFRVAHRW